MYTTPHCTLRLSLSPPTAPCPPLKCGSSVWGAPPSWCFRWYAVTSRAVEWRWRELVRHGLGEWMEYRPRACYSSVTSNWTGGKELEGWRIWCVCEEWMRGVREESMWKTLCPSVLFLFISMRVSLSVIAWVMVAVYVHLVAGNFYRFFFFFCKFHGWIVISNFL